MRCQPEPGRWASTRPLLEYDPLHYPPSVERLNELCRLLGREPQEVMHVKQVRFEELCLSKTDERARLGH